MKIKKPRPAACFTLHIGDHFKGGFAAVHNSGRYFTGAKKIRKIGEWFLKAADYIDQENKVSKKGKVKN